MITIENYCRGVSHTTFYIKQCVLFITAPNALGIGPASFWSEAAKDMAESSTPCRNEKANVNRQRTTVNRHCPLLFVTTDIDTSEKLKMEFFSFSFLRKADIKGK